MAFQSEVGASSARAIDTGTTTAGNAIPVHHDLMNKRVLFMCSQHVATVTVTAGGTSGYAVGDTFTFTDASAHFDPVFEVTGVTAGVIDSDGLRINSNGAFALQVASIASITTAGTGYVVGDILELQGGSARVKAKIEVTSVGGSGDVTGVSVIEGGGVYSTTAGAAGATVGVGNSDPTLTYAGDDACAVTVTDTPLITPLTGINLTAVSVSGTGTVTVTITLAETGWTVDDRNTNNTVINSVNNEKEVVLVGDATGVTNKPYIWYRTFSETVTTTTHSGIACGGLIAHNPLIELWEHNPISTGLLSNTTMATTMAATMAMPDTGAGHDDIDFWFAADDTHFREVCQVKDTASATDDGIYLHHYAGFLDRIGTETENPYPLYIFASMRDPTSAVTASSINLTGLAEQRCASNGCSFLYDTQAGAFQSIRNADGLANPATEAWNVYPASYPRPNDGSTGDVDNVIRDVHQTERSISIFGSDNGTNSVDRKIFNHGDRLTPWRNLRWIPGTVDLPFLWPLTVAHKATSSSPTATDRVIGNIQGCYWIPSDNGSGLRINDFSEDYVEIGTTRYLCFHNGNEKTANQYIAFEMNV